MISVHQNTVKRTQSVERKQDTDARYGFLIGLSHSPLTMLPFRDSVSSSVPWYRACQARVCISRVATPYYICTLMVEDEQSAKFTLTDLCKALIRSLENTTSPIGLVNKNVQAHLWSSYSGGTVTRLSTT